MPHEHLGIAMQLAVTASGLVTAVGFNSPASCAAMRAGIRNVNVANLWDPEAGEYLTAGKAQLPQWWEGAGKFPELVAPAIHECLIAAEPIRAEEIPVLVGIAAADRPHRWDGVEGWLLSGIADKLDVRLHQASRLIPRGRVSGVAALEVAAELVEHEGVPCCIVAAVDSFLQQSVVEYYMSQRRILTAGNSNGFSPGEAGAAVLVRPTGQTENELSILGIGLSTDEATIESDEPLRGDGLAEALRKALDQAGLEMQDTGYRITDLNGEHYKFKEATLAFSRLLRERVEEHDVWHPIEHIGDVGAAVGPLVLAVALHAGINGYSPGDTALCHFSNDDGERAAAVVSFNRGDHA